jgi:hypothetical protein
VEVGRFVRRLRRLCGVALLGVWLLPAPAAPAIAEIPGADAPELAAAIDLWLESGEDVALIAFAELARDGNDAARLLLATIDKTPSLQGPWLANLAREERIALLRQPGGLSGRSWLHALADLPLGAAWLSLMDPARGAEAVVSLIDLGEARAAREALVLLAARHHPDLRTIDPARLDPDLIYLLWPGADSDRQAELVAHRPAEDPRGLFNGPADTHRLQQWLAESDAGAPLDAVCAHYCAATRAICLGNAYAALASHSALLTLGSPVEALIPQKRFLASPRGRGTVLRRILQTHDARGRRALIAQMREHDACLADVLEAKAALYRYRRPGSDGSNQD